MLNNTETGFVDHNSPEPLILIKPDSPYFSIVEYNEAFSTASQTTGRDITGKSIMELHTWNSNNEDSALLIHDLLNEVITKKDTIALPAVMYYLPAEPGEQPQESWWQAIYRPIFANDNRMEFILCHVKNITAQRENT